MRLAAALFAATLLAALSATRPSPRCKPGATAPDFTARASLGGKEFNYALADELKKGPVVLYFYPAAFTPGCTQEAHEFAEAVDKFAALGASVIGVSADDIDVLSKFSVSECRSKFPVAADAEKDIMARLRRGAARQAGIRQPHVLRHRARRRDHLRVHGARSFRPRRQHAGGGGEVEGGAEVGLGGAERT